MNNASEIAALMREQPCWALMPSALHAPFADAPPWGSQLGADRRRHAPSAGRLGWLPLFNTLLPRNDLLCQLLYGTPLNLWEARFKEMVNDPSIRCIVVEVHSPGGSVFAVDELSSLIYESRQRKQTVAVVNSLCASAALWIATAASELVITPTGEIGSVGVYTSHIDESRRQEMLGIKTTLIAQPRNKVGGNPYGPLEDEDRAHLQRTVNYYGSLFVNALARNRGTDRATVELKFGQGRMMLAQSALRAGMVDRVASFDQTLARLGGR